MTKTSTRLPTYYIPHGAGPCFFMDWKPKETWEPMAAWLSSVGREIAPKAILVVSAHWEQPEFIVTAADNPALIFDYFGFPKHTYELEYKAPGAPWLAQRIEDLSAAAGLPVRQDKTRGLDHGSFIPLMVMRPEADVPVVQLSLKTGLDPAAHLALGRALAPLRDEGVLILGSGMSFHNMRGFGDPAFTKISESFDGWLGAAVAAPAKERDALLADWVKAPAARQSHPREEHLIPLMAVAGAALADQGEIVFSDKVMETVISGVRFG